MKGTLTSLLSCITFLLVYSCNKESCFREVTYTRALPVFDDLEKHRIPIYNTRIAKVINPGKALIKNDLLCLEDRGLGVHIFKSKDLSDSGHISFIRIPGIRDFLLEDDLLVVNNFYDIITLDISKPNQVKLLSRDKLAIPIPFFNSAGLPVIGFKFEEVSEKVDCQSSYYDDEVYFFDDKNQIVAPTTIPSFLLTDKTLLLKRD
ncbi:MAG: hypothetical protein IPL46_10085 [Saprospiraceae bacterium]|nr:hypothetical protein [Saprospiraceae bacterium]